MSRKIMLWSGSENPGGFPEPLFQTVRQIAAEGKVPSSVVIEHRLRGHLPEIPVADTTTFQLHGSGRLVNPDIDLDGTSALLVAGDEAEFRERW